MKKSKNQRKKEFLERIKNNQINDELKERKDNIENKRETQEEPSKIALKSLLREVRGHIGKTDDEELDR